MPLETSLVPGGKSDNRWSCQSVLQAGSSSGLHICGVHCPADAGCPMLLLGFPKIRAVGGIGRDTVRVDDT